MIILTRCPVPNCDHAGYTITNNHYIEAHGITKKDALNTYGKPIQVSRIAERNEARSLTFNHSAYHNQNRITRYMKKYYN